MNDYIYVCIEKELFLDSFVQLSKDLKVFVNFKLILKIRIKFLKMKILNLKKLFMKWKEIILL